jgi:hypothetical protein
LTTLVEKEKRRKRGSGVERYGKYEKRGRESAFFLTTLKNEENEVDGLFIDLTGWWLYTTVRFWGLQLKICGENSLTA